MELQEESIESLRTFFRISTAAFDFANQISAITGKDFKADRMQFLHESALEELEKKSPNLNVIAEILASIEIEAHNNNVRSSQPKPPYPLNGEVIQPNIKTN